MNILITGGLGHIGSYIIEKGLYNIKIVDNISTQRYSTLFLNKKFLFQEKDFGDITKNDLCNIDVVIHLAALTDAQNSFNRKDIEKEYIEKTHNFINICKGIVPYFIFPSSTSVYGIATDIVTEYPKYLNPQSPYAETKLTIEKIIQEELGQITKYLILRCGTIFGTSIGMRFHTAINKFCFQAYFNQPLTVWKDNYNQVRPYLGLGDLYYTLISFLKSQTGWNDIYNTISENKSTEDIINIINKYRSIQINFVTTPLLNQYSYNVSNDKILPFYTPVQHIKDGIIETINTLSGKNRWFS
jgi:nucleoside-diphosphate-sugar epimerase